MGKIVMTLLVRRQPREKGEYAYAVQITFPRELSPGEMTSFTSARLLHKGGLEPLSSEAMTSYRPEEWQAADLPEQAQFAAQFGGNPLPWHCVMRSLCRSVYDFPGSGDHDTNNGQVWPEMEELETEWKTQGKMRKLCEDELDAEWNMHLRQVGAFGRSH